MNILFEVYIKKKNTLKQKIKWLEELSIVLKRTVYNTFRHFSLEKCLETHHWGHMQEGERGCYFKINWIAFGIIEDNIYLFKIYEQIEKHKEEN